MSTPDPRLQFPELTKVVDAFKAAFGEVKVKFAEENGVTRGKRSEAVSFPAYKYERAVPTKRIPK